MRKAGIAAAVLTLMALAWGDSYPRQAGIKILHYNFDVTLSDSSNELAVVDTIELQFVQAGVRGIDLDLCNPISQPVAPDRLNPCLVVAPRAARGQTAPAAPPPSSVGRGMTVTAVTSGGAALQYTHAHDRLHIDFAAPSQADGKLTIVIAYHGVPATGLNIGNNRYGDRGFFTDNWPNKARNWLATIDHISVKAPKTISVTAPIHFQVISNGILRETTDLGHGMRRTVWDETQPIPSWQYSLGVAEFAVEHFGESKGVAFSAWVFPQNRDTGFAAVDQTTKSIFDFYSEHIGPYQYEKLAHVEAAMGGGATEPATTIFYFGGFSASSHEMAHHWFGDAVTESDWDDVWLSEGFATYFALLYTEFEQGHDAFIAGVKRTRDTAMAYEVAHPADTVVHNNLQNISDVFSNSAQIYQGGAMVLQTLRGVLGDRVWWAGIRLYYSRYHNASASSDDLRHAFEDACFADKECPADYRDLSWFFHEMLNQGGVPQVDGGWKYDAAAKQLTLTLDQTQSQGLYRLPIQVAITVPPAAPGAASPANGPAAGRGGRGAAGPTERMVTFTISQRSNTLYVPLEQAPLAVELDPNVWTPMMQATFKPLN